MNSQDAIALTKELLHFDTINPPGLERDCAHMAAKQLQDAGFTVEFSEYEKDRTSVIARAGGKAGQDPLCLTGHLDVVPLGTRKWSKDPFAGETDGDKLFGRGSSDMKAGVAAMIIASLSFSKKLNNTRHRAGADGGRGGGCVGSRHLAALPNSWVRRAPSWWASRPPTTDGGAQGLDQVPRLLQGRVGARLDAAVGRERHLQGGEGHRQAGGIPVRRERAPGDGPADDERGHLRGRQRRQPGA
jgi:hypothetical protein